MRQLLLASYDCSEWSVGRAGAGTLGGKQHGPLSFMAFDENNYSVIKLHALKPAVANHREATMIQSDVENERRRHLSLLAKCIIAAHWSQRAAKKD